MLLRVFRVPAHGPATDPRAHASAARPASRECSGRSFASARVAHHARGAAQPPKQGGVGAAVPNAAVRARAAGPPARRSVRKGDLNAFASVMHFGPAAGCPRGWWPEVGGQTPSALPRAIVQLVWGCSHGSSERCTARRLLPERWPAPARSCATSRTAVRPARSGVNRCSGHIGSRCWRVCAPRGAFQFHCWCRAQSPPALPLRLFWFPPIRRRSADGSSHHAGRTAQARPRLLQLATIPHASRWRPRRPVTASLLSKRSWGGRPPESTAAPPRLPILPPVAVCRVLVPRHTPLCPPTSATQCAPSRRGAQA